LLRLKEKKKVKRKQIDSKQISSAFNPDKKIIKQLKKELRLERRKVRKNAIMKKVLHVKDKAFEFERLQYHNKLIYLDERCRK